MRINAALVFRVVYTMALNGVLAILIFSLASSWAMVDKTFTTVFLAFAIAIAFAINLLVAMIDVSSGPESPEVIVTIVHQPAPMPTSKPAPDAKSDSWPALLVLCMALAIIRRILKRR